MQIPTQRKKREIVLGEIAKQFEAEKKYDEKEVNEMQAVSKWEREECYPDITFLPEIAALLACNVNDFFQ